ncbi:MAG: acyloxyacyl hydrolase [Bacteroidales bacterium]|nr:acyloxyacyl hydrolase [Bacteroidales bacterium]
MRFILIIAFGIATISAAMAQDDNAPQHQSYWSVDYLRGPVYDHRNLSGVLQLSTTQGFGVSYLRRVDGSEPWHHYYRYPKLGVAAYYEDFHYPDVLGKAVSGALVADFHVVKQRLFDIDLNIQAGAAYLTKKFDAQSNNLNLYIGAKFAAFFRFGLELVAMPESRVSMVAGANFVHYSNGSMKLPNLGLNLCQLNLGARMRVNKEIVPLRELDASKVEEQMPNRRWQYQAFWSFGCRETGTPEGDKYLVTTMAFNCLRPLTKKFVVGVGIDLMRDGSEGAGIENNGFVELMSGGLHGSAGLEFGKMYAALEMGAYMFGKYRDFLTMYDRVSINYALSKRLLAHVGLRTYLMKAYYIEWGIGCKIGS